MGHDFGDNQDGLFGDLFDEGNDDAEEEPIDAIQGSGQLAARLADGSGYLVVDGPGAGSVVGQTASHEVHEAAPLHARDEALAGTLPLFLVHRPYFHYRAIPRLLAHLHAAAGANLALGVISKLPSASPESHQEFHAACRAAAVHVIDPLGYLSDPQDLDVDDPSDRASRRAPYLASATMPVTDLLDMQRERGANLLLTSGRALDPGDPQGSLDAVCAEGDKALAALKDGERLALNLTMSTAWLTRSKLRDTLLAQVLDQEQFDTWYVRVQWRGSLPHYAQPPDKDLLYGYRRLAELTADEGRRLLLPQTGLTGWLMLAFGAAGFGTGLSSTDQAFRVPGKGGGGKPRIERYFERQLLHTIERTARLVLTADPAYLACCCPYCAPLLNPGAAWSHEYAGLHYLFNAGTLAGEVAPSAAGRRGPYGAVGRKVRSALSFAQGKALASANVPSHLEAWDQVL